MFEKVEEKSPRILLLEDNMQSMQEISDTLVPFGYELSYSIAGHDFSELIYSRKFDLVLYNMVIDGLNGFDIMRKIKGSMLNRDIPVVFITDSEKQKDLMQGLHVSGIDFLKIPYSREELLTRINNQINLLKSNEKLEQSQSITNSIRYAERIQKAITPSESVLDNYFCGHFLINLPRDIVSGDFYWIKRVDNLILVAISDCTGHGVPGAFLSVLGISLLNDICTRSRMENANMILEKLRRKFKETLMRADGHSAISDGMDISLILVDLSKMSLQFSGAYNRLLIARQTELTELKGDLQPIGSHPVEKSFTNHYWKLQKGDKLYMTTDGYVDQFGGENNKKLQYRQYRKLIQELSSQDLQKQKDILLTEHRNWKGLNDQVDDILMIGIEI